MFIARFLSGDLRRRSVAMPPQHYRRMMPDTRSRPVDSRSTLSIVSRESKVEGADIPSSVKVQIPQENQDPNADSLIRARRCAPRVARLVKPGASSLSAQICQISLTGPEVGFLDFGSHQRSMSFIDKQRAQGGLHANKTVAFEYIYKEKRLYNNERGRIERKEGI